jgi:hypothetical protein
MLCNRECYHSKKTLYIRDSLVKTTTGIIIQMQTWKNPLFSLRISMQLKVNNTQSIDFILSFWVIAKIVQWNQCGVHRLTSSCMEIGRLNNEFPHVYMGYYCTYCLRLSWRYKVLLPLLHNHYSNCIQLFLWFCRCNIIHIMEWLLVFSDNIVLTQWYKQNNNYIYLRSVVLDIMLRSPIYKNVEAHLFHRTCKILINQYVWYCNGKIIEQSLVIFIINI